MTNSNNYSTNEKEVIISASITSRTAFVNLIDEF